MQTSLADILPKLPGSWMKRVLQGPWDSNFIYARMEVHGGKEIISHVLRWESPPMSISRKTSNTPRTRDALPLRWHICKIFPPIGAWTCHKSNSGHPTPKWTPLPSFLKQWRNLLPLFMWDDAWLLPSAPLTPDHQFIFPAIWVLK